ncbi:MAG TPA: hypothetical protein VJ853_06600 [Thermoanaerobaculia bacterium]|nr:hypothetical protein [Thermoanaerobaculia bacterium]
MLVIGLLLAGGSVVYGPWDHDGGAYLLRGAYAGEGLRPYINYPSIYPPLIDALTAPAVWLPVSRLTVAVGLPILWLLALAAASFALGWIVQRDATGALILAALSAVFTVANGGNHLTLELGVALFGGLAFASAIAELPLLAGLFAACATLSKQTGILVFVPLLFLIRPRDYLRALCASAVPLVLCFLWIRDLHAMWNSCVSELLLYSQQSAVTPPISGEFVRSPETVLLLAIVIIAAILVRKPVTWVALVCAAVELLPRLVRNYPHYTINAWPFIALILAFALTTRVRIAALGAFAALAMMHFYFHSKWQKSPLLTTFNDAAQRVAAITPPNGRVRQYGAEPIIEFLADRHEDVINKPVAAVFGATWDGSRMYSTPASPDTTVVVIDRGQPWVRSVFADLHARGFAIAGSFGRIWIFRSRPTAPAPPAAPH